MAKSMLETYKKLVNIMPGTWAELRTIAVGEILLQPAAARRIIDEYSPTAEECGRVNRPIIKPNLMRLEASQLNEDFLLTGDTAKFDKRPKLIDANHRFHSCAETGIPMPIVVVLGVEERVFEVVDQGTQRRTSDVLAMLGQDDATTLSAAANCLYTFTRSGWLYPRSLTKYRHCGNQEIIRVVDAHPDLSASAAFVNKAKDMRAIIKLSGMMACFHYLARKVDRRLADGFFAVLDTIAGDDLRLPADLFLAPAAKLREKLMQAAIRKKRLPAKDVAALVAKAWNFCLRGDAVDRVIYFPNKEDFPRLDGFVYADDGTPILSSASPANVGAQARRPVTVA